MSKKIQAILKLQLVAGKAAPGPPLGPTLGQHGVNIQEFIQAFNNQTANQEGVILPVKLTVYQDRSFDFEVKQPLVSYLIKQAVNIEKGSSTPKTKKVGVISHKKIEEIAKLKIADLNTADLAKAMKIVEGTAKSLGIEIK
ncbi:50S ribosomal protein L11 [bacterium]|nr:MAG: 50S ribosomal protein L11 [bacterium]